MTFWGRIATWVAGFVMVVAALHLLTRAIYETLQKPGDHAPEVYGLVAMPLLVFGLRLWLDESR